jgi:alkylhydroperoxidase family enzyme
MAMVRERIEPQTQHEWSDETRRLFGGTLEKVAELEGREAPATPKPLNILRTIAHHPRLLQPFLGFAATLAAAGVLPRRASEILALRAAWNCASAFEWGHHVLYARSAGLSENEIARVAAGPEATGWDDEDRALLRAADELHRDKDVTQPTWQMLRQRWDTAQLVEITFIVGHYTMLSMVANATGVPLEADLPAMPARDEAK